MREWAEQRQELLRHVEELRERARLRRDEAAVRQLAHGFGEAVAQYYHAEAARLEMAASVVACAVHLIQDVEAGLKLSPYERAEEAPREPARAAGLPLRPECSVPPKLCPLCGAKRHWKDGGSLTNPDRPSVRICRWRQWAVEAGLVARDDYAAALPEHTTKNDSAFTEWLDQHPRLVFRTWPN